MMHVEKLVEFIHTRNAASSWVSMQTVYAWFNYLRAAENELADAEGQAAVTKALAKMLIVVLSMAARYSTLDDVFSAAMTRMQLRAPYVGKNKVTLQQELELWEKGK